jgi:hypothetical protein
MSLFNNWLNGIHIYIYCSIVSYRYFEDYIISINKILKATIITNIDEIYEIYNIDIFKNNSVIIICQSWPKQYKIDNINKNLFLLNTEQLTIQKQLNDIIDFSKEFTIIDYSKENIDIMNNNNIKNVLYFPYIYNEDEIYNIPKQKDICMLHSNTTRRSEIMNNYFKNIKIDHVRGWKKYRDNILFKYKIILNISAREDYNIFESIRCYRCLFNKMIIISEEKYKKELIDYENHIIFAKIEDIPEIINNVLSNYDYYYKKLDLDNINYTLNNHFIDLKNLLSI